MEAKGVSEGGELNSPALTVKITEKSGKTTEFSFYDTDGDRKSRYTVNGEDSMHYINRDYVKDMISYTQKLLNGETFSSVMR